METDQDRTSFIRIEMGTEQRALILGANISGALGIQAYKKVLALSTEDLKTLKAFVDCLIAIKEKENAHE